MPRRPALLLLPLLLAACAGGPARDPGPLLPVAVALTLPTLTDARELELRLSRTDGNGQAGELLVQQVLALPDGGMPASAELALPRASIGDDDRLQVEALLRDASGRVLLSSMPAAVQRDGERGSAGPLRSAGATGEAPAPLQGFRCGEVALAVAEEGDELLLALDGAGYRLQRVEAASGARYRRDGATAVEFWNRGDEATLRVGESALPTCQRVAD